MARSHPIVRADGAEGREAVQALLGLIPPWAKNPAIGGRLVNARAETVTDKPAFREAFRSRRCIVPVTSIDRWSGSTRQHYQRLVCRHGHQAHFPEYDQQNGDGIPLPPSYMLAMLGHYLLAGALAAVIVPHAGAAVGLDPLVLERKIPLGAVRGRIDHLRGCAKSPAMRRAYRA